MPSEFHLIRIHDKLEPSKLSVEQLAAWAAGLPSILEVRHHHLERNAPLTGDQSKCNCRDLTFDDSEYYRPGSPLHPNTHKDTEL
jgi:hypothetical protein